MSRNNTIIIWVVIIVVIAILVGVFGRKTNSEEVKIGVILPLTGGRADAGEFSKNAAQLALEEIKSEGSRYPISLTFEDSKYEPQTAVTVFKKLTDVDGVKFIVGPYGSSEVMAVGPIAEKSHTILIAMGAQSDEISELGDYIFRVIHHSSQEAPVFGPFLVQRMKSDTVHFLALNTAISDPYIKALRPELEKGGKKIGLIEKVEPAITDFKTELTKIKAKNPTDIFLVLTPKLAGVAIKQASELGIKAQFYNIGVEGPELIASAGALADGLFYPYSYDITSDDAKMKDFYEKYVARYGKDPDAIAANSYDSIKLLSLCFDKVGIDTDAVKTCLYGVKNFVGASGTFSFDDKGDVVKNIIIKTIKDGKFIKYSKND